MFPCKTTSFYEVDEDRLRIPLLRGTRNVAGRMVQAEHRRRLVFRGGVFRELRRPRSDGPLEYVCVTE